MKIGIFTDTYKPDANGCAQSAEVLANNLIKFGHEVYIFCPSKTLFIQKDENIISIPAIELKKLYGYKVAQPIHPELLIEVEKLKLDIIHAETEFGVGTAANFIAFYLNIPLVRTYHTDYIDYTNYFVPEFLPVLKDGARRLVALYEKAYGDHCLRLMTPSTKTKDSLDFVNIKTKIDVVPNGIELERFNSINTSKQTISKLRESFNVKENEKLIIYVGRLADEKRVDLVIRTFKRIKENKLNIKLLIVGLGPSFDKLVKLTKDLDLNDYVNFTGKIDTKDVPKYYHASDFFISASTSETQGLTYIEALASGLPIIVAYDDVLSDLLIEGKNGYSFTDENTCFEAINMIVKLDNLTILKMKKEAVESANIYDAKKFASDTLKIYEEVIEEYKTSYVILKTKVVDDTVKLTLKNKMQELLRVSLSIDDYLAYGFRNNSLISSKQINEIKEKEPLVLAYKSALRKLAIRDYSSKKMAESLKHKFNLNQEQVLIIIDKLKKLNLINDENYTVNRINVLKQSLLSKRAIFTKLIQDGISKELIEELYKEDDELIKIEKKALKYQSTVLNKSLNAKKQLIISKLVRDGFNIDDVKDVVFKLDFSKELLIEDELLKSQAEKAYNKYSKKYEGYELRNHIFNYLASKGFSQEAIYAVINEMEY